MDAMKILGGLLGGGLDGGGLFKAAPSGGGSLADALGGMLGGGSSRGGGLTDALGGLLGGGSSGGGDLITSALGSLTGGGRRGSGGSSLMPLLTMALGAASQFMGRGQGGGGLSSFFGGGEQEPQAPTAPPPPPPPPEAESEAVLLIKSMIAAAYADGRLDQAERQAITDRMESLDLDDDERAFIANELLSPAPADEIVGEVKTREQAWHVYAVSILAINVDTWEERRYLQDLAQGLKLSEDDRAEIKRQLGLA